MGKIKIVGHTGTYDYDTVAELVILLASEYYFKNDMENLIKIKVDGKFRLYRKVSPIVCFTLNRTYNLKSNCHRLGDGLFLERNHEETVKLEDGTYTHLSFAVEINSKYYLKSDENIVRLFNGGYNFKSNTITLSYAHYGKEAYTILNDNIAEDKHGEYVYIEDSRQITFFNTETNTQEFYRLHRNEIDRTFSNNVISGFKDKTNPQVDRVEHCWAKTADVMSVNFTQYLVLKPLVSQLEAQFAELAAAVNQRRTDIVRAKINSQFSDLDETENTAVVISPDYRVWGGKEHLFGNNDTPVLGRSFTELGGLGYSFGIEIETSAGVIPRAAANIGFIAVGDRSIGAAEYVTPVLQGNKGLKFVKDLMEQVRQHCFVDDRDAIHIHVGSPVVNGSSNWNINFNTEFAMASIKLGCDIEEDLYKILPKSRHPYNRHCHSILRYKNVNKDNIRNYLAAYVFGPEERWSSKLNFNNYLYNNSDTNKHTRLNSWCGGRYKWLNLVRCYSACSSPTIEFRIFSPTTNVEKVYMYLLISLAFTHAVNSRPEWVMAEKRSLSDVLKVVYEKSPTILATLLAFVETRQDKFKRKVVYTGVKPEDIVSIEPTPVKIAKPVAAMPVGGAIPLSEDTIQSINELMGWEDIPNFVLDSNRDE